MDLGFEPLYSYVLDKLKEFKKSKTYATLRKDKELDFLYATKKHPTGKIRFGWESLDDSDDAFEIGRPRVDSDSDDDSGTGHDDRFNGDVSPEELYAHVIANKKETYTFQTCFEGFLCGGKDILSCLRWFEKMKKDNASYEEFMDLFAKIMGEVNGIPDRVLPSAK